MRILSIKNWKKGIQRFHFSSLVCTVGWPLVPLLEFQYLHLLSHPLFKKEWIFFTLIECHKWSTLLAGCNFVALDFVQFVVHLWALKVLMNGWRVWRALTTLYDNSQRSTFSWSSATFSLSFQILSFWEIEVCLNSSLTFFSFLFARLTISACSIAHQQDVLTPFHNHQPSTM